MVVTKQYASAFFGTSLQAMLTSGDEVLTRRAGKLEEVLEQYEEITDALEDVREAETELHKAQAAGDQDEVREKLEKLERVIR